MKKMTVPVVGALVFFLLLGVFKDQIIKAWIIIAAKEITGAEVSISQFSLSLVRQSARIKGFRLYNPPGFPQEVLADVPEVFIALDVPALLRDQLHLRHVRLSLKELRVIKNRDGKMNYEALRIRQEKAGAPGEAPPEGTAGGAGKSLKMRIDLLTLSIGDVMIKDYTVPGEEPSLKVFNINMKNKELKDITDASQLVSLVMFSALKPVLVSGAGVYGAATLLGAGFLPAGMAAILVGKDSAQSDFKEDLKSVFTASLGVLRKKGRVRREDLEKGLITAEVQGASVNIRLMAQEGPSLTKVIVSARKMLLPRPELAAGIIYGIRERLK
jgi:hypothetical protein